MATFRFARGKSRDTGGSVNWVALGTIGIVTAMQLLMTQWSAAAELLGMAPLRLGDWALVATAGFVVWAMARLEMWVSAKVARRGAPG